MAKTTAVSRTASSPTAKLRQLGKEIYKARWPYLFISPFYILFLIFGIYPIFFSLYLSFTEWKGLGPIKFVGWKNFELLMKDKLFWHSMGNGVILFFMYVPIMTFFALVLAVMLNSKRVRGFRILPYFAFHTLHYEYCGSWLHLSAIIESKVWIGELFIGSSEYSSSALAGECVGCPGFSLSIGHLGMAWLQHGHHARGPANDPWRINRSGFD